MKLEGKLKSEYKSNAAQVVRELTEMIHDGRLSPGQKLPSERIAAEQFNTTRATVQYAYRKLQEEDLVIRKHGAGTFVKEAGLKKMDLRQLNDRVNGGMTSIIENAGGIPSSIVIDTGVITGKFFTNKLGLEEGAPVFALHRVRCANKIPMALEYTYVPADYFDDIQTIDFAKRSLYEYMESKDCFPEKFNEVIQIVEVVERERVFMELPENVPVYWFTCTAFDKNGRIVEYTETFARCDMFELNLNTRQFASQ